MITHIDITGVRYTVDDVTKKYIMKKIGRLDRFLPRHARKTAKVEVVLKEVNRAKGNKYECDILVTVPQRKINAKDSTLNMLAAVDIVEAKLTTQLKKYHDEHAHRAVVHGHPPRRLHPRGGDSRGRRRQRLRQAPLARGSSTGDLGGAACRRCGHRRDCRDHDHDRAAAGAGALRGGLRLRHCRNVDGHNRRSASGSPDHPVPTHVHRASRAHHLRVCAGFA